MGSPFNLRNGSMLLSTEAPGGVYNSSQLKKIASLSESNAAIIRATEDQRIALIVPADKVATIAKDLKSTGLGVRHYQDGMHQPVACIGALCPEHQQDALSAAMDITKILADITSDTPVKIGINGCATCCVPCHTYDVSVIGDTNGYRISLGGKNSQIPEMATFMAEGVPPEKLPSLIQKIVLLYKEHAEAGERLQEVMERVGSSSFVAALAPYSQDAAGSDPFSSGGGGDVGAPDNADLGDASLDDADLGDLTDEAAGEAAEIVSDAAALEPMDELTVPVESEDTGEVIDDIDPQGFGGGDLSSDVLIADTDSDAETGAVTEADAELMMEEPTLEESTLEEPMMTAAEAYENSATDDGALELAAADSDLSDVSDGTELSEMPELSEIGELSEVPAEEESDQVAAVDDEDEIERKLNASIEETGATPVEEDENAADREAAASMIDSVSAVGEDDLEAGDYSTDSDADLDNATPQEAGASEFSEGDSSMEFESIGQDEETPTANTHEAPVVEVSKSAVLPLQPHPVTRPMSSEWQISAVDVDSDGKYVLQFSSGARLRIDPNQFSGSRQFTVAGKAVAVTQQANGMNISVDGIEIFVPQRNAA